MSEVQRREIVAADETVEPGEAITVQAPLGLPSAVTELLLFVVKDLELGVDDVVIEREDPDSVQVHRLVEKKQRCFDCGRDHRYWVESGTTSVRGLHHRGTRRVWECGFCGHSTAVMHP